jgi:hypothetical protein
VYLLCKEYKEVIFQDLFNFIKEFKVFPFFSKKLLNLRTFTPLIDLFSTFKFNKFLGISTFELVKNSLKRLNFKYLKFCFTEVLNNFVFIKKL